MSELRFDGIFRLNLDSTELSRSHHLWLEGIIQEQSTPWKTHFIHYTQHTIKPTNHHHTMKFTTALLALLGSAAASPVALAEPAEEQLNQLERRQAIGYVQNYNGNLANFKYNQGAGTFTANWNNPGDFVVGLGWNTGTANRYDHHMHR
jgi:hypothetical protein